MAKLERLQKVIAHSGITSRRKAEQMIIEGKVSVNDEVVSELGTKVSTNDRVTVNGVPLEKEQHVYFAFHKPNGVITSVDDEKGRKTVIDYFQNVPERIYPIGRLDYNTSGLILLTNDGEFANLMMHPKYEINKTYMVTVKGQPSLKSLQTLEKGIENNGEHLIANEIKRLDVNQNKNTTRMEVILNEGKNHQVRRMMEAIGCDVVKLRRDKFGLISLNNIHVGQTRRLTPHEVKQMKSIAIENC